MDGCLVASCDVLFRWIISGEWGGGGGDILIFDDIIAVLLLYFTHKTLSVLLNTAKCYTLSMHRLPASYFYFNVLLVLCWYTFTNLLM